MSSSNQVLFLQSIYLLSQANQKFEDHLPLISKLRNSVTGMREELRVQCKESEKIKESLVDVC